MPWRGASLPFRRERPPPAHVEKHAAPVGGAVVALRQMSPWGRVARAGARAARFGRALLLWAAFSRGAMLKRGAAVLCLSLLQLFRTSPRGGAFTSFHLFTSRMKVLEIRSSLWIFGSLHRSDGIPRRSRPDWGPRGWSSAPRGERPLSARAGRRRASRSTRRARSTIKARGREEWGSPTPSGERKRERGAGARQGLKARLLREAAPRRRPARTERRRVRAPESEHMGEPAEEERGAQSEPQGVAPEEERAAPRARGRGRETAASGRQLLLCPPGPQAPLCVPEGVDAFGSQDRAIWTHYREKWTHSRSMWTHFLVG